jgi:hypothetical protein
MPARRLTQAQPTTEHEVVGEGRAGPFSGHGACSGRSFPRT